MWRRRRRNGRRRRSRSAAHVLRGQRHVDRADAALLVIDRLRENMGLSAERPSLHMCFTGNPGTGKTTVARLLSQIYRSVGAEYLAHAASTASDQLSSAGASASALASSLG